MNRTLIVSRDTVASLLEAHAALAAWYHRHAQALGASGLVIEPPPETERRAFLDQLATHFPELAAVAQDIASPRPYVPPPAIVAVPAPVAQDAGLSAPPAAMESVPSAPEQLAVVPTAVPEPSVLPPEGGAEPDQAPGGQEHKLDTDSAPPASVAPADVPPPPLVDPTTVKY